MATVTLDRMVINGAHRGGREFTELCAEAALRPREVVVRDVHPERPEVLASLWRQLGSEARGEVGPAEIRPHHDADLTEWAVDDPASLSQGLRASVDGVQQFGILLASRVPATPFSYPVVGLGGTVLPREATTAEPALLLLDSLGRMTRRTTSRAITREAWNESLVGPVRREVWRRNVRHACETLAGSPADGGADLFVSRISLPIYPVLYALDVVVEESRSRHLMQRLARERAALLVHQRSFALAAVSPRDPWLFFVFLARPATRDAWCVVGALELPHPQALVAAALARTAPVGEMVWATD